MTPEQKAKELSDFLYFKLSHIDYNSLNTKIIEMHEWTKQQLQDEFMKKAENAFCNQCIKNPCRIKIEHGSLCYYCELFLKHILKEL